MSPSKRRRMMTLALRWILRMVKRKKGLLFQNRNRRRKKNQRRMRSVMLRTTLKKRGQRLTNRLKMTVISLEKIPRNRS